MRKIFAILILGIVIVTTACADNDVIHPQFKRTARPGTYDFKAAICPYQSLVYQNRQRLVQIYHLRRTACQWYGSSFDSKGDWTEVDGKRSEVPAFFIPKEIKKQVNEMFPGEKITKIEKDSRKYEVELTNDVKLKFEP